MKYVSSLTLLAALIATPAMADDSAPMTIGESTRALLGVQRSGAQGGNALPMLGVTSSLSYQRYLDSYKYKIPEHFSSTLQGGRASGGSGAGQ